jgi:hypothetical protein
MITVRTVEPVDALDQQSFAVNFGSALCPIALHFEPSFFPIYSPDIGIGRANIGEFDEQQISGLQ